jgi:hypothetical protein
MAKKIKLFYPTELFNENHRDSWFELLKSKQRFERDGRPLDQRIQKKIEWVDTEAEADLFILPHDWSYYYKKGNHQEGIKFCENANVMGKKVLSFSGGDQGITVPVPDNTIVYRQSGYRSKRKVNERTSPFFLSDPITVFLQKEEKDVLKTSHVDLPIVGFCGMAPHGIYTGIKERLQIVYRNSKKLFGSSHTDKQSVMSTSNLRFKVLETFKSAVGFRTNYIIRQKYRGGAHTPEIRKKTTEEYYQNQINSDLVICVRGVGNFSLRFYETLAMGRIPVFIDTDSPLPDIRPKNWNDYIIWVDSKEVNRAPEIAKEWLSKRDLRAQQRKNRQLWVEHFRGDNYWLRELENVQNSFVKNA